MRSFPRLVPIAVLLAAPSLHADPPDHASPRLVFDTYGGVDLDDLAGAFGLVPAGHSDEIGQGALAAGPGQDESCLIDLMDELEDSPGVSDVRLDGRARPPETTGCDLDSPYGPQQCTIGFLDGSEGEASYVGQSWLDALGIPKAQDEIVSSGIVVAVIDSGIDPLHPALDGKLAGIGWDYVLDQPGAYDQPNGLDDDGDGFADEAFGHGTHVASTITLIAPNALILPYRVVDADGRGWAFDVAQAVVDAIFSGASIINLSLSIEPSSEALTSALEMAMFFGVEIYSSAGNTGGNEVLFPANLDLDGLFPLIKWSQPYGVVSVTAVDEDDQLAPFAAWGDDVDIAAPGVDIYGAMPGGMWGWWSGTSMATAIASGTAALVRSTSWFYWWTDSAEEIIESAVDIDAANGLPPGSLGGGRLDAGAAAGADGGSGWGGGY